MRKKYDIREKRTTKARALNGEPAPGFAMVFGREILHAIRYVVQQKAFAVKLISVKISIFLSSKNKRKVHDIHSAYFAGFFARNHLRVSAR